MELIISNYLLAVTVATASAGGTVGGLISDFSEKELVGLADMYQHSRRTSERFVRSAGDTGDFAKKRHAFSDYKHCCGDVSARNRTGRKETFKVMKSCAERMKTKYNDLEQFGNPITDEFSCERLNREKNRHYCFSDCVLKDVGALQENDAVDKPKAKEFLTKGILADWLKEIVESAVDNCVEQKDTLSNEEQLDCSPLARQIKHCVRKEVLLNCPENYFNNSGFCLKIRKAFQEMNTKNN